MTFDAPVTARSATRPACSRSRRSRSSSSRVPSAWARTQTVRARGRARHGSSFEWCSSSVVRTTASSSDRERSRELVDRFGRVLREEDDVPFGVGTHEPADAGARVLERGGADPRLVAAPAVHAGRVGQEALDGVDDASERGRARGVVEVDVADQPPVEQRNPLVAPDDLVGRDRVRRRGRQARGRGCGAASVRARCSSWSCPDLRVGDCDERRPEPLAGR